MKAKKRQNRLQTEQQFLSSLQLEAALATIKTLAASNKAIRFEHTEHGTDRVTFTLTHTPAIVEGTIKRWEGTNSRVEIIGYVSKDKASASEAGCLGLVTAIGSIFSCAFQPLSQLEMEENTKWAVLSLVCISIPILFIIFLVVLGNDNSDEKRRKRDALIEQIIDQLDLTPLQTVTE